MSALNLLLVVLVSTVLGADRPPLVESTRGMVVSVSPEASDAGLEMLKAGGNAVDAAVATALALAVTFPEAGNIGGGGFMMVWPGTSTAAGQPIEPVCVEYRETCPAALGRNSFVNEKRQEGHHTVGVPGTVRGLALAHEKFGKLKWSQLVAPAIRLADEGFPIDAALATALNKMLGPPTADFAEFRRIYGKPDKSEWKAGDRLVQPELTRTLKTLADEGPDSFYRGRIAEQIAAEMQAGRGFLTKDDLANYKANLRKPVHTTYRGHDVYAPPPPSAGGTQLIECLNILEQFDVQRLGPKSPRFVHLLAESMRRAACDRCRDIGDPDFTPIPAHLGSKDHAKKLASEIDLTKATRSESLAPDIALTDEPPSTTHFSVADGHGMAVANTYTLQNSYGSRVVVRGAGFLLNNEMTDFNWRPGVTTRKGELGTEPNVMAPGKRMLSSQCPTLAARDGKLLLVTGSPGGRTIPSTALCLIVNVLDFGLSAREAVDAPRWHHQWLPDRLQFERLPDPDYADLLTQLKHQGHSFSDEVKQLGDGYRRQGDAHTILIHNGVLHGAADWRRTVGKAAGW
ncbi:MAG: gamma-glutamyltransferase [Planctomycetota bacterium]